jgi:hypothetical protein
MTFIRGYALHAYDGKKHCMWFGVSGLSKQLELIVTTPNHRSNFIWGTKRCLGE